MASQVSAQGFFQFGDFGAKAPLGKLSQFPGIVSAAGQFLQHLNGGCSGNVGDDALKLNVRAFKRFLQLIGCLSALARERAAMTGQLPQVPLLPGRNEAGTKKPMAQQVSDPLSILNIALSPRYRFHVDGIGYD
jgi:hypothetical protein